MIPVGSVAPVFKLPNQNGQLFDLASFRGKNNVLLLFLPAAFTPICTTELPALAALAGRFLNEANTVVAAVTVDNTHANLAWARACGANNINLLSDFYPHGAWSAAYGAWLPAEGISDRSTVIIGKDGLVKYSCCTGKFGKRSIPQLLALATQINGGTPVTNAPPNMPLDLPVLFAKPGCPYCEQVKGYLNTSGLSQRIVVRDTTDPDALRTLLAIEPMGDVPALWYGGRVTVGADNILALLRQQKAA